MILKVFGIYDGKALAFGVPYFMLQTGEAVRAFNDLCNDPQSKVNKHPGDYSLYEIGSYDDNEGKFQNNTPHILLGHGNDYKRDSGSAIEVVDQLKEEK